jgi:small subunit ribosomal protein S4
MYSKKAYKICRRLGAGVFDKCQTQQFTLSESRHEKNNRGKRKGNLSDYGKQFIEKQKIRFSYGITEKQLRRYNEEAQRVASLGGNSIVRMLEQLEMRIDNVVYRSGLVSSRRAARQLVSHGHVHINGVRTTIPSVILKEGDVFSFRERTKTLPIMDTIKNRVTDKTMPLWISFDKEKWEGKILSRPTIENTETPGSIPVLLEFYSR